MNVKLAAIVVSMALIIGGPVFMWVSGYEVFVLGFWVESMAAFFTQPGLIMSSALGDREPKLFQSILMVGVGICLALTTFGVALIANATKKKGKAQTIKMKETKSNKGMEEAADKSGSVLSKINSTLGKKKPSSMDEFEDVLDESEGKKKAGFGEKWFKRQDKKASAPVQTEEDVFNRAIASVGGKATTPMAEMSTEEAQQPYSEANASIQNVPTKVETKEKDGAFKGRMVSKTARVKISSNKWEETLNTWKGKLSGVFAKKGATAQAQAEANRQQEESNARNKSAHASDIEGWYAAVRDGSRPTQELVSWAKEIVGSLNEKNREAFLENVSIDGMFVLRLAESWASRSDFEEELVDESDPKEMMRRAVRALKEGRATADFPESMVPDDFKDEIELDEEEDVVPEEDDGFENDVVMPATNEPESNEEENDEERKILMGISPIAKEMREIIFYANQVRLGVDDWPEEYGDEDFRMEAVLRLDEGMARITFLYDEKEVKEYLKASEAEEMVWLYENFSIIEQGFELFARDLILESAPDETDETPSDEAASSEESDEDDMPQEDPSSAVEEDGEEDASQQEEEASGWSDDDLDGIDSEIEEAYQDEEEAEDVTPSTPAEEEEESQDPLVPEDITATDVSEALVTETQEDTTETSTDEPSMDVKEVTGEEEKEEQEAPAVVPVYVPRDIAKEEVKEIEFASDEVMEWGAVSKQNGASAGTMVRFMYDRSEGKITAVGIVHLVMVWKEKAKPNTVNVIFRYLEEGTWSIPEGLNPVRENGDFVSISKPFLEHEGMKDAINIIHFVGPGAASLNIDGLEQVLPNAWRMAGRIDQEQFLRVLNGEKA